MKKMLRTLAIALLCLMLAIPASAAAPVLVADDLDEDLRWIYGSSFLRVTGKDGYSMNTVDGSALTGALYTNFTYDKGIVTAAQYNVDEMNYNGAFDVTGKTIIPFEYGMIEVESSEWAVAMVLEQTSVDTDYDYSSWSDDDVFYIIKRADVYHLPEGTKVAELARENFHEACVVNHCINIQDRTTGVITTYDAAFNALGTVDGMSDADFAPYDFTTYRENGQYGIKDAAGNVIMAPSFSSVYVNDDEYAVVYTGETEGLVSLANGEIVLPAEFESVKRMYNLPNTPNGSTGYEAMGYFVIIKDGKVGYAVKGGAITCEPKYSKDIMEINGASSTLTDLEGKMHILAADGVESVIEGYERVYALDYCSGMYYKVSNADGQYGVIDWHGEIVLPCEYRSISSSADGKYVLANVDYEKCQLYELSYPTQGAASAPVAEETPVEEPAAEGEQPSNDNSAAIGLINSAVTLLQTDASANGAAAVSLLQNAAAMLTDANAAGLLNSAATLLNTDAAANAAAVESLLNNALAMLQ